MVRLAVSESYATNVLTPTEVMREVSTTEATLPRRNAEIQDGIHDGSPDYP
jgi:hypothetical protein